MRTPSKRLVLSYVFDWIVIIGIAAVGGGWNWITPYHRPFSLVSLDNSYPFQHHERIPTWLLVVCGLIIPAAVTFVVCLVFVPGPSAKRGTPRSIVWKRKLWEWNTAWMGLALSLATAFMVTQGMKLLFGKPRPDLLSRCDPDLDRIAETAITSVAADFNPLWVLVTSDICQNTDMDILNDGFKSFPSGHASFSWAGLLYLALFLSSKFSVFIPFLPPHAFTTDPAYTSAVAPANLKHRSHAPLHARKESSHGSSSTANTTLTSSAGAHDSSAVTPLRYQAAAPPVYTLILVLLPIGSAIYITSTRFTDFRHFGFDLLFGTLIGVISAWVSFRWYHLPITRGAGWSWGPRSWARSWGIGVGVGSYVGREGWSGRAGRMGTDGNQETVAVADDEEVRPVPADTVNGVGASAGAGAGPGHIHAGHGASGVEAYSRNV